jgi:hypothetical protein
MPNLNNLTFTESLPNCGYTNQAGKLKQHEQQTIVVNYGSPGPNWTRIDLLTHWYLFMNPWTVPGQRGQDHFPFGLFESGTYVHDYLGAVGCSWHIEQIPDGISYDAYELHGANAGHCRAVYAEGYLGKKAWFDSLDGYAMFDPGWVIGVMFYIRPFFKLHVNGVVLQQPTVIDPETGQNLFPAD